MSGAIAFSGGGDPTLARVIADAGRVRTQLDTLTEQAGSGFIASTYAGLGRGAPVSLSLAPQIASLKVAQTNIDAASGPAGATQTVMTHIQTVASNLFASMPDLENLDPVQIDTIAAEARDDLKQVADLLNTQYAGVYVFSGQDSTNPPVPDSEDILSSGFFTQIQAAVGTLGAHGAAATAAATLATASSNSAGTSPFSAYLSQPPGNLALPSVATGDGQTRSLGLLASANSTASSTGSSTTGSYMRDLMRALATVASLSGTQATDPGFGALLEDTRGSLSNLIPAMATDVGVLGEQQASLTATQASLKAAVTVLTGNLASAQEVDMAATLSNLTMTQSRLQASYQLISTSSSMSLVKFLPAS